jgi:hypothetical protein
VRRRLCLAALLIVSACWTGHEPVTAEPIANHPAASRHMPLALFHVVMERTGCMGPCPSYTVTIRPSGVIEWLGEANVAAMGPRGALVGRAELERLSRAIDKAHFFELDDSGRVPTKPSCIRTGNTLSCSMSSFTMCSDTPHAIITVTRGSQSHMVDDAHCSDEDTPLIELETLIDEIAKTDAWVGR